MPEITASPPIPISLFASVKSNAPIADALDLATLADPATWPRVEHKSDAPVFSPALFEPGQARSNRSARHLTALMLDYDSKREIVTPEAAFEAWEGLERYLYTTFSHTTERPCFRVVLPLAEPIPAHEWSVFWHKAEAIAEGTIDAKTKDPARIWYAPTIPKRPDYKPLAMKAPGVRLSFELLVGRPPRPAPPALRLVDGAPVQGRGGLLSGINEPRSIVAECTLEELEAACAFMNYAHEHAAALTEPAWRAQLSSLLRVEGGEELAHEISAADPRYQPHETAAKLDALRQVGPLGRDYIADTEEGRELCASCPHFATCRHPIMTALSVRDRLDDAAKGEIVALEVERIKGELRDIETELQATRLVARTAADPEQRVEAGVSVADLAARRKATLTRLNRAVMRQEEHEAAAELSSAPPADADPATWQQLDVNKHGLPHNTPRNLLAILGNDPHYAGLGFDELAAAPRDRNGVLTGPGWFDGFGDPGTGGALLCDIADRYRLGTLQANQLVFPVYAVARENRFHPVQDWLLSLPRWDGTDRVGQLVDAFNVEPTALHRAYLHKTVIAAIARVFDPGCQVDTMLVLQGAQGAKKTSALRLLFEGPKLQGWFSSTTIDLTSKDARLAIHRAWVTEFAELAALGARDAETIKAFISEREDFYRVPYGAQVIPRKRRCLFVGSTNEEHFLRDPTGSRRFWVLPIGARIDTAQIVRLRDQLFAQALIEYAQGAEHWLDDELAAESRRVNASRWEVPDPIFESLLPWFEAIDSGAEIKLRQAAQQAGYFGPSLTTPIMKRVAANLRRLGFIAKHTSAGNVWVKP